MVCSSRQQGAIMLFTKTRLQQQPARFINRQQQQSSGSGEFQPRRAETGGEGYVNQADGTVLDRSQDDRRRVEH
jgi:hypothetical protein